MSSSLASDQIAEHARSALAKARRRLLPFMFALYVVAYLDRINVGFAALQMNRALGLSEALFGLGSGMFFVGYVLLEIPSNLALTRFGARRWIARIMVSWGLLATAMTVVVGPRSFCILRLLLGAAEAGFFPGIILYLSWWFPSSERARAVALFATATALAGVIGGPLSGVMLSMSGILGLAGWQWLFLLQGLPSIILGFSVLRYLPDGPSDARWLEPAERSALAAVLASEPATSRPQGAFDSGRVWALAVLYFTLVMSIYGISFWLPQIIRALGISGNLKIGMLSALPFAAAAWAMVQVGRSSDYRRERRWHFALAAWTGAAGLALSAMTRNPQLALVALCFAAAGTWGAVGPFWAMPAAFLQGRAAAVGIALINSVGNVAGFVSPYLMGLLRQATGGFGGGLTTLAAVLAASGLIALAIPRLNENEAVGPMSDSGSS